MRTLRRLLKRLHKFYRRARKAFVAFFFPAAGSVGLAMQDGDLTRPEGFIGAGVGLVAAVGVYQVPNESADKQEEEEEESMPL